MIRGTYVLIIDIPETVSAPIGAKGVRTLGKGRYAYVGSAQGGIAARVQRHLRTDKKRHWHIDHVLDHGAIVTIYYKESGKDEECRLATLLHERCKDVPGIGASDCRCPSHLFLVPEEADIGSYLAEQGYAPFQGTTNLR
jgi:Uri superfamily endonuclease